MRRKELEILSTCAGSLRWLHLNVHCSDTEAFSGLGALIRVTSRQTRLKVRIAGLCMENEPGSSVRRPNDAGERTICELLKIIAQLNSLREVSIGKSELHFIGTEYLDEIESVWDTAVNCFRRKRVDVQVFGGIYG